MSGVIWSKFFWSDYADDPALKLCSLGAQGLWMRMLCIASAHDPIGYVAVAGRGLTETDLARLTGASESEVVSLLGELDRNGVFSRDRQCRIYSRRMVRDARKAATAKKNGKKGGNPTLCNNSKNPSSDNPPVKPQDKPQEPRAKSQSSSLRSEDGFDAFWSAYPKRDGANPRKPAEEAYRRALRRDDSENILRGAKLYAAKNTVRSPYVAQAVTWLNQDRWRDEIEKAPASLDRPAGYPLHIPPPARAYELWRAGLWQTTVWGPPPGETGCQIPDQIQSEWLAEKAGKQIIAARVG